MSKVVFNEETLRYVRLFQDITGCMTVDCVESEDKIVFVVKKGEGARAIGRKGEMAARLRKLLKRDVQVVEYSEIPEEFVANIFRSYDVKKVEIEDREGIVHATVTVEATMKGRAIGREGKNLRLARQLISRHHPIQSVNVA